MFGYAFDEVAEILDQTPANCRQLASRARRRVRGETPPARTTDAAQPATVASAEQLAGEFLAACRSGDVAALVARLADEVVVYSDGGGVVPSARAPVKGADRVARFLIGVAKKGAAQLSVRAAFVNGVPGLVGTADGAVRSVMSLHVVEGRIQTICVINNPHKLAHLTAAPPEHP